MLRTARFIGAFAKAGDDAVAQIDK